MKFRPDRRQYLLLVSTLILSAGFLFLWQSPASLQTKSEDLAIDTSDRQVAVRASKLASPHVTFDDSRQLNLGVNASGSQPVALSSGDLDSDGIADVVTVDASGSLQLLKGIDPANYAIDPAKKEHARPEPFTAIATGASLGISPDYLFAGDFNADGKQDILGASKAAKSVVVVFGDGTGHFSQPVNIAVGGNITAIESGEIGKPDGQTDLAVAYTNNKGSFLAVFEHPESAFKHAPEIIKLPSAAGSLAVGNMDEDFYSDIAVACGNDLVIIHERGQAYPWDIVKDSGITRPPAIAEVRKMQFSIAAMAVGRFSDKRGTSLTILGRDGNIYNLHGPKTANSPAAKLSPTRASELRPVPFEPADTNGRKLAVIKNERKEEGELDAYGRPTGSRTDLNATRGSTTLESVQTTRTKPDLAEIARQNAADLPRKAAIRERTKAAFVQSISAKATRLAKWEIMELTSDYSLAAMATSGAKLTRAAVSDSPVDDLIVTSPRTGQVEIISQFRDENGRFTIDNAIIDGTGGVQAILPMRLNLDGMSDLILLRTGSASPEVMMTAPSATFTVNTTDDDGDCNSGGSCSLRDAIRRANSVSGSSTIYFSIPVPTAIIAPLSPLPAITQPVTIMGNHLANGTKTVEIDGTNAGAPADGLKIRASNAFIYDIAITGFKSQMISGSQVGGNGIVIESDSAHPNNTGNNLLACFLGIDAAGTTAKKNMAAGLLIFDSDENFVTNTVSSGNNTGIAIEGGNSNGFAGNIIGLDAGGTAKVPNYQGMFLAGADNRVGGDSAGFSNTISGNGVVSNISPCVGYGIYVAVFADLTTLELLTHDNSISGNKIGTDPTGAVGLGNCWQGINTNPITSTTIGSITDSGRNLISGNGWGGVWCEALYGDALAEGGYCSIMGNNVGTDISGTYSIYNDAHNTTPISSGKGAVSVLTNFSLSAIGGPGGTIPGGPCTGFCNLVSGNAGGFDLASGIEIGGPGIVGIFNNYVGTKRNGMETLGNNGSGIDMASTIVPEAAPVYYAGGQTIDDGSLGNLVAGNSTFSGIGAISNGGPGDYHILSNLVGTNVNNTSALPNGFGIYVGTFASNTVEIGDISPLGRNVIAGNASDGIAVLTGYAVKIVNNAIGVTSTNVSLGNGGNGINVGNLIPAYNTTIGGTDTTSANIIANNGKAGVKVNAGSILNPIRGNSIQNNAALGIDLSTGTFFPDGDGDTDNDCLDGDTGANGFQNYPVLLSTATDPQGNTKVIGYLRSSPSQDFSLDFYSNDVAEPGNHHGEGKVYVGSMSISTNGSGFRSFEYTLPATAFGLITSTATDAFGNTSEFSCDIGACTDPVRPVLSKEEADELYAVSICADPIVVNNTSDAGDLDLLDETCDIDDVEPGSQCSLRAAIQEAEHQTGANAITFDIPGGGTHTITPATPLPVLDQVVSIDASTQPGYAGIPLVVLDGNATTDSYGFSVRGGGSLIKGFSVVNFKEQVVISGNTGNGQNRIGGNYIGVRPDGTSGNMARQSTGVTLKSEAANNQIGGFLTENRNIIGSCGEGISVSGGSNHNRFNNNYVGIAADGVTPISNHDGIVLRDSTLNNVGGYINESPNVISSNQENGIILDNSPSNRVSGNFIGTTSDGAAAAGNATGVNIRNGSANNFVGGTTFYEKNVISGQNATNNSVGVLIKPDAGVNNTVAGNYLGVSLNGDVGLPNRVGIAVNADNQTIGNAYESQYRNLIISADTSGAYGVYLHPFFPNDELINVTVQNNTIGTLRFNNANAGEIGVYLTDNVKSCTVKGNTIGHQGFAGIRLFDGPHNNTISGNRVGIKTTNDEIPNYNGIAIRQADTNFVRDNTVSANTNNGIVIGDSFGQNDRPGPVAEQWRVFGGSAYASNNIVTGNRVGTDIDSKYLIPNGQVAIGVGLNARDTRIGGPGTEGNIVGGASGKDWPFGIVVGTINDAASVDSIPHNIKIEGNWVGISTSSTQIPNGYGIYVRNAADTVIGGDTATKGNVVANNSLDGIRLFKELTTDSTVQNNFVGVLPDGNTAGNGGNGISIDTTGNIEISYNTVGANQQNGIYLANLSGTQLTRGAGVLSLAKVFANCSGCFKDLNGILQPVGNALDGIRLDNVFNAEIGKLTAGVTEDLMNKFAGNSGRGIQVQGGEANKILSNLVGTGKYGELNVGNLLEGLKLDNSSNNTVGGVDKGNTFSGNGGDGIRSESSNGSIFSGNLVGVLRRLDNQLQSAPNGANGLSIINSALNSIGDPVAGGGNIFSANQQIGVLIDGFTSGANRIWNNKIGVVADPPPPAPLQFGVNFGNGSHGIRITNAANGNMIGSPLPGTGNIIGGNGGSGVWIDPTAGPGNLVDPNSIFGNVGLGIDLGTLGHSPNDVGDADEGPNRMQNYPQINLLNISNGDLLINYSVDSLAANSNYGSNGIYVEFFEADLTGEGERFIGSDYWTLADLSNGGRVVNLGNAAALGISEGDLITASATDADGNTSEFFPPFSPSAAGVTVGGQIVEPNGNPIGNAILTLTDTRGHAKRALSNAFGFYRIEDVEVGQSYVMAVSHKRYTFTNPSRVIIVDNELTGVNFTSDP